MGKRIIQRLGGFLAAALITSTLGLAPVKAATLTADQLYANAYSATVNALNKKSQDSINEARSAISSLKGTKAAWAIGEFSKQVDQVQQKLINQLKDAYYNAALTPTQKNIASVEALRAELMLSSSSGVRNWADAFTKPMRSAWSDPEIVKIKGVITDITMNLDKYSYLQLNGGSPDVVAIGYYDANKEVKCINYMDQTSLDEIYYSNNQNVLTANITIDDNKLYFNQIYFKDNTMIKWLAFEFNVDLSNIVEMPDLTSDMIKSIKVYDNTNIPDDLKAKLTTLQQTSDKLLADA